MIIQSLKVFTDIASALKKVAAVVRLEILKANCYLDMKEEQNLSLKNKQTERYRLDSSRKGKKMKFSYKVYKAKSGNRDARLLPDSEKVLVHDTIIEADNGSAAFNKLCEQIEINPRYQIIEKTIERKSISRAWLLIPAEIDGM